MPTPLPRVAVVGAGAAGLTAAKALLDAGITPVVLERGDTAGGLWVQGNASSPAYDSLHLNTSKGRTELADLPMPADWPDYPSAARVAAYLQAYADRFGVTPRVRFGTTVTHVERTREGWDVTTEDVATGARGIEQVDAVVVANGHNWDPRLPGPDAYPGTFTGEQRHAHDHRSADEYRGRRVLVVGMGNSAMDIAVDASHTADRVLLSARHGVHVVPKYLFGKPSDATGGAIAFLPWRLRQALAQTMLRLAVGTPQSYGLPAPAGGLFQNHPTISDTILHRLTHGEVAPKPGIARFDGGRVEFTDGTVEDVDVLVWATGYRVSIPFLGPRWLGADAEAMPLFQRVFHLDDPTLTFVGLMQSTGAALPVVEAQARLVAAHLAGTYALPTPDEQRAAVDRAHAAAVRRWGAKRPMMRIDFDRYVAAVPRELAAGVRRARRGAATFVPVAQRRAADVPERTAA